MTYRARMRTDQIAVQLYTVRREAAKDLRGTLEAVARAGYRAVEVAGLPDTPPGDLADLLSSAGLDVVAAHEGIDGLRTDPGAAVERMRTIGSTRVIVPSMPEADRSTADDVRRFAAELNGLALRFAAEGLRFGYHNHSFEFAPLDGTTIWDILLAELFAPGGPGGRCLLGRRGRPGSRGADPDRRRTCADLAHEGPRPGAGVP